MDFRLSEAQQQIKDTTRRFADEVITPRLAEMGSSDEYFADVLHRMSDLGIMGVPFPEAHGGSGADWVSMAICMEEIARGDVSLGEVLNVNTLVADELLQFGTEAQKQEWLGPIVRGEKIGAFGLTEAQAGSDAGATQTEAALDGDEWVIKGSKRFVINIGLDNASIILITARTKQGEKNVVNTFIVRKDTPGLEPGKRYEAMAECYPLAYEDLYFNDCRIPRGHLLGDEGKGFSQHLQVLQTGRIGISACCVGLAQACFEQSLKYAKERMQFGKPIFSFQGVSFKLADMAMQIELARNMVHKAAWLRDNGLPHLVECAYAKLFSSEMCEKCASDAVEIHGGYGLIKEYPVSRYWAQCKLLQIVQGTSEIQRVVISRNLSL